MLLQRIWLNCECSAWLRLLSGRRDPPPSACYSVIEALPSCKVANHSQFLLTSLVRKQRKLS